MIKESEHIDFSAETIVVIGSKPHAALPEVNASFVLTANSAVLRGCEYRKRYGSRIIALVSAGVLKNAYPQTQDVREALKQGRPEEIVILCRGDQNPEKFISICKKELGLHETEVSVLIAQKSDSFKSDTLGWRRFLFTPNILKLKELIWFLRHAPTLLFKRRGARLASTSGLNAIFYAMKRFGSPEKIISAGIGLEGGGRFGDAGRFNDNHAKYDRIIMKRWPRSKRPFLFTTDDSMSKIGDVPKWQGKVFYMD